MRTLLVLALLALAPVHVAAQDTAATPDDEVAPPPVVGADVATTEPQPSTTTTATPPDEAPVPPIMVAVLSTGRVPDDVVAATQSALVDLVTPMAGARPVLPLAMPEMRARLAACADAPCQGAFLGEAGAIGAVVARLSRRTTRGPIAITIEMIDPVSGAPRITPVTGELTDAATAPAALAPLAEQLRTSMFSPPPPPPTLRITINVDGAEVSIDGASVGESPIATQRLRPGRHVITVTRPGYSGVRREVELDPGEQERVDLTLDEVQLEASQELLADGTITTRPETPWYEEWYVWVGVGAGVLVIAGVIIGAVVATQPAAVAPDPAGIPLPPLTF